MVFSVPLPADASDQATVVWQEVAESLTIGDIEKLHDAVISFISLSDGDKKILEDMASVLPYPGIPPALITEIFANPEATVGLIERLGSNMNADTIIAQLGTAEQAIVLDALISWLKSEQKIAETLKAETKTDAATAEPANPLNTALQSYITTAGAANIPLNMGSLQFLKNNAIALAGLNIADPALLNQAYQVASHQLLITLLPEINTSNLTTNIAQQIGDQARNETIQTHLIDDIRKSLQDGAIPLNMQTFLVLWTAITMPAIQAPQIAAAPTAAAVFTSATADVNSDITIDQTANSSKDSLRAPNGLPNTIAATSAAAASATAAAAAVAVGTSIAAGIEGITSATGILPASPIVASVLASIPALVNDKEVQATPALIDELGMLSYIYSQMAPYWSGPAAVSLMAATKSTEAPEQKKLESSVRAFAIALGALINDPNFDRLLASIIGKSAPAISAEQLKVFIAAMKISILTNALVALYIVLLRKTQGQFRADELAQLILGPPIDERGDIDDLLKGLVKSIRTELLNIPKEKQATFINDLLSCYNKNTDINSLVDPAKQFLNLLDTTINDDKAANTKG